MPDRLVAQYVGGLLVLARFEREGAEASFGPRLTLGDDGIPADEVALLGLDEAVHAGLTGRVGRPVLGGPGAEVLVEAHAVEGA